MKPVEWRPQARRDAAEAAFWFSMQGGLPLGEWFLAQVDAGLDRIAGFPGSGSTRHACLMPDLPAPLRFAVLEKFDRYLIYYLDLPTHVEVIRIRDAARGLAALMDEAEPNLRAQQPGTNK